MSKTVATLPELTNVNVIGLNSAGVVESRPLRGGETVVTNFIVEDTGTVSTSSSKTLQTLVSREFFLRDTVPPVYFDYSAANLLQGPPPSHAVKPGGTSAVQDDQAQGALLVRHVLTFGQPTDEQLDALFADPAASAGATNGLGAFGSHVVPAFQFVPNAPLLLSRYPSLATSKVVRFSGPDAWTVELVADSERKTIVSTVVAQDASGNKSRAETSYVVIDTTAPAVGPVSVSEVTDVSARVSAQATDSGDANAGVARTATYAGLFETASLPTNAFGIVAPSFDPATGLFAGAIENKVFGESGSVVFGAAGGSQPGSQPLDDFTEYTVFVCAVDSCPAKNASAFRTATFKTLDGTPPVGLDLVSLATASVTATSVAVEGLDLVTDAGDGVQSLSLFYGLSPDFASAVQAAGSPFSPGSPSAPTATFVVGGLDDATLYHFWVSATDGRNPAGPVPVGTARTLDATDPVISSFDATQTAGGYSFSATGGTLVDNADGPMKAYLVMCSAPQTTEQLEAILVTGGTAMQASAKNESFAYSVASGAAQVSSANLTASEYWTGTAWAPISETAPSAPHQLWAHLLVVDAAGNAGSAQNLGAIKTVADRNAPTVSTFGATQSPTGYTFSLDASTRVADTRAGPLKTYFFLATAAIGDAKAFVATHASNAAVAKNEAVAYSPSSGAVAPPALTASKLWNGSAWTDVVEATTTLNAHFVVLDAAGLAASATVAKTVTDVTAPAFSGTVALTAEGQTSVKAAWSAGIADGRGVTEGRVYYSTTAPAATTAAGIAAWKAAATTYFAAVSPLSLLSAAGSATVTGLTAGTTYHAYLCAKDAAGNELNVATGPASVATAAVTPISSSGIFEGNELVNITNPNFISVSGNNYTVSGSDLVIGSGGSGSTQVNYKIRPTSGPFTFGMRVKFANANTGSVSGSSSFGFFFLINNVQCWIMTQNSSAEVGGGPGVYGNDVGAGFPKLSTIPNFVKTDYFWMFITGNTPDDTRVIAYNPDNVTRNTYALVRHGRTGSTSFGAGAVNVVIGQQLRDANTLTIDRVHISDNANLDVSPATLTWSDATWRSFDTVGTWEWNDEIEYLIPRSRIGGAGWNPPENSLTSTIYRVFVRPANTASPIVQHGESAHAHGVSSWTQASHTTTPHVFDTPTVRLAVLNFIAANGGVVL